MPFKGTDRDAYKRAGKASSNPKKQSQLYKKFKTENEIKETSLSITKNSTGYSYSFSKYKPSSYKNSMARVPIQVQKTHPVSIENKDKIQKLVGVKNDPKTVKTTTSVVNNSKHIKGCFSFSDKQSIFATSSKKTKFANSLINKFEDYLVDELTRASGSFVKLNVKKVISNYLPADLVERIEKAYDFIQEVNTYIKIGKKVYNVIIKVLKTRRNVSVVTSYSTIDNVYNDNYKHFYKNNISTIRQFPDQINKDIEDLSYSEWRFAGNEEECNKLFNLVISGKKTATCCLAEYGEHLTENNQFSILTNFNKSQKIKIKTIKQYFCKFCDVTAEHAMKEGEGDLSLNYWRKIHAEFFKEELTKINKTFNEEINLLCEEFAVEK